MMQCVAVSFSLLQCVAACCSVLQVALENIAGLASEYRVAETHRMPDLDASLPAKDPIIIGFLWVFATLYK